MMSTPTTNGLLIAISSHVAGDSEESAGCRRGERDHELNDVLLSHMLEATAGSAPQTVNRINHLENRAVTRLGSRTTLTIRYCADAAERNNGGFPQSRDDVMKLIAGIEEPGAEVVHIVRDTSFPTNEELGDVQLETDRIEAVLTASGSWRLQYISCPQCIGASRHGVVPSSSDIEEYCSEVLAGEARNPRNVAINEVMREDQLGPLDLLNTRRNNAFPTVPLAADFALVHSILGKRNVKVIQGS